MKNPKFSHPNGLPKRSFCDKFTALSRGCSSVGRALAWHARGREFESHQLLCTTECHHTGCGYHFNVVLLRNSHGSNRTEIRVSQVWVGRNSLTDTRFGRYDANFYRIIV
jgi:hypothetical protein